MTTITTTISSGITSGLRIWGRNPAPRARRFGRGRVNSYFDDSLAIRERARL
ncbi:hypothetical protein [Mycolicibacterium palauense]|uniref:hypothetical protein n=1 Tax=Mycolicibacterium palauense TaxID=2034511 RepID=UPI00159BC1D9|nr:hypothetical protein [Mycolicibacterium palauense]